MVRSRAWAPAMAFGLVMAGGFTGSAVAQAPGPGPAASGGPGPSAAASNGPSPGPVASDSPAASDSPSSSGPSPGPTGSAAPSTNGTASASPGPAPTVGPGDAAFLSAVHQADMAEIGAAQDAVPHAVTACVMRIATALANDHGKLDGDLTSLAGQLRIGLPQAPDPAQHDQLARIGGSAGTDGYDTQWLGARSAAQTGLAKLIDQEIASGGPGDHARVVATAQAARPVVAQHLAMVRACHVPTQAAASTRPTPADSGWRAPDDAGWSATDASVIVVGSALVVLCSAWATRRWHRRLSR